MFLLVMYRALTWVAKADRKAYTSKPIVLTQHCLGRLGILYKHPASDKIYNH